jgi:hypothetical protein
MNKSLQTTLLGYLVSNTVAFALIGLSGWLMRYLDGRTGILATSQFIIIPTVLGIVSAWFWRSLNLTGKALTWNSILNGLIAIVLSSVFLGEGFICLIIVSPLLFCFVVAGAFWGQYMFQKNNQKLNVSFAVLLFILFIGDTLSKHEYENMVSDSIIINAPPQKVWPNVVSFKPIKQKNNYWLFKIGMPSPSATTVTGNYVGAGRKCIFSNGYVFSEKIVTYDTGKDLTFDIVNQPRDPEIMGHIDIERGQFLLKDNGDGTTTLVGNSWYKLYVFPVWYYDRWAQSITRNVHLRVMEHIKEISEKN